MSRVPIVMATSVALLGSGCVDWEQVLRQRASFEMGCPEAELEVTSLGGGQRGVRGCGCQAVYVGAGTSWVLNTHSGSCRFETSGGEDR